MSLLRVLSGLIRHDLPLAPTVTRCLAPWVHHPTSLSNWLAPLLHRAYHHPPNPMLSPAAGVLGIGQNSNNCGSSNSRLLAFSFPQIPWQFTSVRPLHKALKPYS
jgi:hypothetical protein